MREASAAGAKVHKVERGHSLWGIAKRYGVTVAALRDKNSLEEGDPIKPGQELEIPGKNEKGKRRKRSGSGKEARIKKPSASTQTQKSAQERGVNPCNTPDPGYGIYDRWSRAPSMGQMIMPQRGGVSAGGRFDVMFHFHGHEPVRKEWVQVMDGAVLVGIDLGLGSGPYGTAFQSPKAFENLVTSVEKAVAAKAGKKRARVRHVGLSAWSAGYGAVQEIIGQNYGHKLVDTVVLLDGLHSGYSGNTLNETQLKPFIDWTRDAVRGRKFFFVSHSSIIPPGYASTTETANFLVRKVGGKARRTTPRGSDPMGLDLISRYSRGNFHVRGYNGNDKMDHCAHIGLYRDVLKVHVKRRWNSPRGYKKK
jgi:murein DD-endopeptidase MepM/ murein hydrolase activator NlpD